ncbi:MAG: hypothetical protein HUJ73_03635, partial [Eubacterium sp.]|nr:hypothetical protein [Eubacterium sp.]
VTMDVRVTKDGIPVLFHDLQVYRMTEKIGTIEERSLEEVKELRLSGTEEQIPTLKEALDLIDARVPVLVELHVKENVEKLCDAVCEVLDRYDGVFAVQSIDPCVLRWFHSERNEYIRGQMIDHNHTSGYGIKNIIWDILTNSLLLNFLTEPDMLVCNTSTRYNPSMWLCRILYRTPRLTWTIRTEEEYAMEKTEGAMVAFEGIEP